MNETKDLSNTNTLLAEFMGASAPSTQLPVEDTNGIDPFIEPQGTVQSTNETVGEPVVKDTTPEVTSSTAKPEEVASGNDSWDDFVTDTSSENTPAKSDINWSVVGKAIGIKTEVKSPEDVVSYVSTLEKTVQDLKSNPILGENVPKDLKEAIEIAEKGGDYLAYLDVSSVDYASMDPVEIYEDSVAELFYNPDGSFREADFEAYLERQDPMDKKLRGLQIKKELMSTQEVTKQQLKQRINAEKAESLKKLESSLNSFNGVGDFKATPKIKKQLHDDLASGKFLQELGINLNGAHNWESLLNTYFKAKYFDAVQAFNEKKTKTSVLRGELDNLTNSTVKQPSRLDNPTAPKPKSTGVDLYLDKFGLNK